MPTVIDRENSTMLCYGSYDQAALAMKAEGAEAGILTSVHGKPRKGERIVHAANSHGSGREKSALLFMPSTDKETESWVHLTGDEYWTNGPRLFWNKTREQWCITFPK